MSTTVWNNTMDSSLLNIRDQLEFYENELKNDNEMFNEKLNSTRRNFFNYINELIEELYDIKRKYESQFNYLEKENKKTCDDNEQRFKHLCSLINQHENDQKKLSVICNEFKQIFPMRPNMFKNIPDLHLQKIPFDSFIKKDDQSRTTASHHQLEIKLFFW
jgi:DNA repair ATPase RecN